MDTLRVCLNGKGRVEPQTTPQGMSSQPDCGMLQWYIQRVHRKNNMKAYAYVGQYEHIQVTTMERNLKTTTSRLTKIFTYKVNDHHKNIMCVCYVWHLVTLPRVLVNMRPCVHGAGSSPRGKKRSILLCHVSRYNIESPIGWI